MIYWRRPWTLSHRKIVPSTARRWLSAAVWEEGLQKPVQAYISTSRDPYLNLSIEHDILTRSAKESVILFLYVNRPSVIIGRNQNPWLEVNLPSLNGGRERLQTEPPGLGAVDLVRRRSGGGTVFHDEGNVNWTVICPKDQFTRDKHAEMVVRALRSCGIDRARVNERHDIVLDQGKCIQDADSSDTHVTPWTNDSENAPRPLKVSGSAYKITGKHRALHHGTCLLSSPNLDIIPDYLHSPAKPFIKDARGVQSVSSPVGNIVIRNEDFTHAVHSEFVKMYSSNRRWNLQEVGEDALDLQTIHKGVEELKSNRHIYEQTPRFTISNASDEGARVLLELSVRESRVVSGRISNAGQAEGEGSTFEFEESPKLHEMGVVDDDEHGKLVSWDNVLEPALRQLDAADRRYLLEWLDRLF